MIPKFRTTRIKHYAVFKKGILTWEAYIRTVRGEYSLNTLLMNLTMHVTIQRNTFRVKQICQLSKYGQADRNADIHATCINTRTLDEYSSIFEPAKSH